jgi:hypothetical protein
MGVFRSLGGLAQGWPNPGVRQPGWRALAVAGKAACAFLKKSTKKLLSIVDAT